MRRSQFHCSKKTEHVRSKRFGLLLARCANASMCWFALCEINVEDQCCVALMAVFSLSLSRQRTNTISMAAHDVSRAGKHSRKNTTTQRYKSRNCCFSHCRSRVFPLTKCVFFFFVVFLCNAQFHSLASTLRSALIRRHRHRHQSATTLISARTDDYTTRSFTSAAQVSSQALVMNKKKL